MNDGFIPFKGLGWAVAGLLALTAIMSGSSGSQWDALRLRTDRTAKNELQRPSLLKKLLGMGGGTTTGTTTRHHNWNNHRHHDWYDHGFDHRLPAQSDHWHWHTSGTTSGTITGTMTAAGYPELSMISSNFSVATETISASIPVSNYPDDMGAFRFLCGPGQVLADDPIVYPGQPGKSHLHQFYGNTTANAYSDLRLRSERAAIDLHVAAQPFGLLDAGNAQRQG